MKINTQQYLSLACQFRKRIRSSIHNEPIAWNAHVLIMEVSNRKSGLNKHSIIISNLFSDTHFVFI